MALVGLDGRFQRVNRALCDLLGRSEAELLDSTIADLAEPGDDPVLRHLGRAAAARTASRSSAAAGGPTAPGWTCSSAPPCSTAPTAAPRGSSARSRTSP